MRIVRGISALFLTAALLGCSNADAALTISVSTHDALVSAIAEAAGGETIRLTPGDYGDIVINNRKFPKPVTIVSADPLKSGHIRGIFLNGVQNLVVKQVEISRALDPGEPVWGKIGYITQSKDIHFESVNVHGSLDSNAQNDGWGFNFDTSDGIIIRGSEFHELARTFVFGQCTNILIADNDIHDIATNGGGFAAVDNVTIEGNRYHDFYPTPDAHPDAIQFWTAGQERGSTNIVVRNNEIIQGDGIGTQGIFIADEVGNIPHRNITIENNLLFSNDQYEGITAVGADGVVIANNTVLSAPGDDKDFWIRVEKVANARISGNVADRIVQGETKLVTLDNNLVLKDEPKIRKRIPNLAAGRHATAADLVLDGAGYQPAPVGAAVSK